MELSVNKMEGLMQLIELICNPFQELYYTGMAIKSHHRRDKLFNSPID